MPDFNPNDIDWFEFSMEGKEEVEVLHRSVGILPDGSVLIPSVIADARTEKVFMLAGYDGIHVLTMANFLFVPADWAAKAFPENAGMINWVVDIVKKKQEEEVTRH